MKFGQLLPLVFLSLAVSACGSENGPADPLDMSREELVGSYVAESFIVTVGGQPTDVLGAGGELTLLLNATGSTSGHLVVPGGVAGSEAIDEDLSGTFQFDEDEGIVTLDHPADTFLRDLDLSATRSGTRIELRGNGTFPPGAVEVVLVKQ